MSKFTPEFIREQRELARLANITEIGWSNSEFDCGGLCTPNGCPGHDDGCPTYLEGVTANVVVDDVGGDQWICEAAYLAAAANNYPDALAEIERLRATLRWIPVSERLPECVYGMNDASDHMDVAYRYPGAKNYFRDVCQYWKEYGWVHEWKKGEPVTFEAEGFVLDFWRPLVPLPMPPEDPA